MPWVKIDDQFASHPKVLKAGPAAAWLYICGLTYCNRYLTDGFIPAQAVRLLADLDDPEEQAAALVNAGLWEVTDGGYMVHDFLDWNPSAEEVRSEREAARERMHKLRSANVRQNFKRTSGEVHRPDSYSYSNTNESIEHTCKPREGVQGEPLRAADADAPVPQEDLETPAEKPPGRHKRPRAGPDLAPLVDAFRALGLPDPAFTQDEAKQAQELLRYYTPDQIAECWQAYAEHRWGDKYDWDRLSFRHLAGCQRVGNWLRDKDRAREPPTRNYGGYSQKNHI